MLAQKLQRERDLVAEVDDTMAILDSGVRVVCRGELLMRLRLIGFHVRVDRIPHRSPKRLGVRDVRLRRHVLVARAPEEIEQRADVLQRVSSGPVALQGQSDLALRAAVEMLADEDHLLGRREDAELPTSPELQRELAEDLVA